MNEAGNTPNLSTPEGWVIDGGALEMHAPELYQPGGRAHSITCLEDLDADAVSFYREQGYLAVENAFNAQEVAAGLDGLLALIMGHRPDFKGIIFEHKARETLSTLTAEQRQDAVRKIQRFVNFEERLRAMAFHPQLLGAVRTLLGDEPHLFADQGLIKPPLIGREKPWHQDHAYFNYPLGTRIVGVWIALDEATLDNGCMQLLPGLHKDGPIHHFQRRDWQICDQEVLGRQSVAVPLKPGGLLFFDALTPHGTPHNTSPKRRRALQFHYAPKSAHENAEAERLRVFGSEGKNVTC